MTFNQSNSIQIIIKYVCLKFIMPLLDHYKINRNRDIERSGLRAAGSYLTFC
jgi:hypothetical protein